MSATADSTRLSQRVVLLDHQGGHRLPERLRRDLHHPEGEIGQRAQLLHQSRVRTTLVQFFERLGLVHLQESRGMQGEGGLSSSTTGPVISDD